MNLSPHPRRLCLARSLPARTGGGGLCLQKKRGGEGRRGELFGAVLPFPLPTLPFPHETRFNANKLAWLRAAQETAESTAQQSRAEPLQAPGTPTRRETSREEPAAFPSPFPRVSPCQALLLLGGPAGSPPLGSLCHSPWQWGILTGSCHPSRPARHP